MVTSPHSLASAAGVDVLRAGGSAVDAAIATSAVLAVTYPHMTGLGGDAFWLIHEGATGEVKYLNGGGKACAGASLASLDARGLSEIPLRGIVPATLTVPGAVASWTAAHDAYGKLPLSRVLEGAISYARDGFPVTGRLADFIALMREELANQHEAAALFLAEKGPPRAGSKRSNPALAGTLQAVAEEGWSGFYEGTVAEEMARWSQEGPVAFFISRISRRSGPSGGRRLTAATAT
jgi:gamma-glutamyltranspeptidase/glutathione hydrolase